MKDGVHIGKPLQGKPVPRSGRVLISVRGSNAQRMALSEYLRRAGLSRTDFVWRAFDAASGGEITRLTSAFEKVVQEAKDGKG